jgi:hypothetical protein
MTTIHTRSDQPLPKGSSSEQPSAGTELDLAIEQLAAMARFHERRQAAEAAAASLTGSREQRMDAARRLSVLQRQHNALIEWSQRQFRGAGDRSVLLPTEHRALLGHRNSWFADKLTAALGEHRVQVLTCCENGADLIGTAVAEQPDVVLVEDGLQMMATEAVVHALRALCPRTLIAAQVDYSDRIPALIQAGANHVFVRQTPPTDVAAALAELLG